MDEAMLRDLLTDIYRETDKCLANAVRSSRLVEKVRSMLPESTDGPKDQALVDLKSKLADNDEDDVLVSLEKFISVSLVWIEELQRQPAAPDYSGVNCSSSDASFFNTSTEVNVNRSRQNVTVWDSLIYSPNGSINGSAGMQPGFGDLSFYGSCGAGGGNGVGAEAKRELDHARDKISALEKRLITTEEMVEILESEKKEVQQKNQELQKKVQSMDRRISDNFSHQRKIEDDNATYVDERRRLEEMNTDLKSQLDNAMETIKNMTVDISPTHHQDDGNEGDEESNSDSGNDEKRHPPVDVAGARTTSGADRKVREENNALKKRNLELTLELQNIRAAEAQADLKTPAQTPARQTSSDSALLQPGGSAGGGPLDFTDGNADDVFSGDISCDGLGLTKELFGQSDARFATALGGFPASPFQSPGGPGRWGSSNPPSAQSTPFVSKPKRGGRIESLGAEIRATCDDRSPLCEKSFSSRLSQVEETSNKQKPAQLVDCGVQTDEVQTPTEYPPVLLSQENPSISSEKQPLEDDDEDYVSAFYDCEWLSRVHLRVLLVLLVGLLVFTFAGAVEVRGRKLYPITWSHHLPEPLVFLSISIPKDAPF